MPQYIIRDTQTNRIFRVTGDAPPTDDEAAAILAAHPEPKVPAKPTYELGKARAEEALNGVSLGWGDEGLGLAAGLKSMAGGDKFSKGYNETTNSVRSNLKSYEADRPYESTAVNLAGSAPLMLAGGLGVASKAGTAARLLRAAGAGAAIGGTAGAGNTTGDLASRAEAGAEGAVVGGVAAPALTLGAAPVVALAKLGGRAFQSAPRFAENYVGRALARDAVNPTMARAAVTSGRALADLGGENVVETAEQSALTGRGRAEAKKFYDARRAAREGQMVDAVRGSVSDQPMYEGIDAASAAQQKDAAPLYEKAYAAQYKRTPALLDLSTRPAMGGAARAAMNEILNDPKVDQKAARETFSKLFGPNYESLDDAALSRNLTQAMGSRPVEFRALDYMKRGLDRIANAPDASRAVRDLRTAWREELKSVNPDYQSALNSWAGPARLKEAYEAGRGFSSMDPEELTKLGAEYGPSERAALRSGAARELLDSVQDTRTGRGPVTTAQNLTNNTRYLQRLQAVLGDESAGAQKVLGRSSWKPAPDGSFRNTAVPNEQIDVAPDGSWTRSATSKSGKSTKVTQRGSSLADLEASVTGRAPAAAPKADLNSLIDAAQRVVGTDARETQVLRGSQTARRAEAAKEFDAVGPAVDAVAGGKLGLVGMISKGVGAFGRRVVTGANEKRRYEVAKLMFNQDPAATDQFLLRLASPGMATRMGAAPGVADAIRPRVPSFMAGVTSGRGNQ